MITVRNLSLDLVLPERILFQVDQIFVDGRVDVPLQLLHVFGNGVFVVCQRFHVRLKIADKLIIDVFEADTRSEPSKEING